MRLADFYLQVFFVPLKRYAFGMIFINSHTARNFTVFLLKSFKIRKIVSKIISKMNSSDDFLKSKNI